MPTGIKKAVSIIFKYKQKVYVIKRHNYLRYFPGYTAFPGGKIEKGDHADQLAVTLMNALKREAQEELGVKIDDLIKSKHIESIEPIALATTPEFNPYRFETHFFLVKCNKKIKLTRDEQEMAWADWISPYDIIRQFNSGECLLVGPIKTLLEKLSFGELKEYIDFDLRPKPEIPVIEPLKDLMQLMPLSQTLPPAERTNCFLIGDQSKLLVDPSPKDTDEFRKLSTLLDQFPIANLLITHHHGDHHQFAPNIAQRLNIPILISQDSFDRIRSKFGEDYFLDVEVKIIGEGAVLGRWIGQELTAISIPGHDQGHMGIMPVKKNWFIVGDLFQGIGTVVVGGSEGSMSAYFESLKKVIELSPDCVIPSHGIALGGTNIIEKTLQHREERERQVYELLKKDKNVDEIVKTIYFDIPRTLHPYAKANIQSHIIKLQEEGKIKSS